MVIAHLKVADTTFTVDADIAPQLQGWTCYWCKGKAQIVVETDNATQKWLLIRYVAHLYGLVTSHRDMTNVPTVVNADATDLRRANIVVHNIIPNTSGYHGVTHRRRHNKLQYRLSVMLHGRKFEHGYYKQPAEAAWALKAVFELCAQPLPASLANLEVPLEADASLKRRSAPTWTDT
jgi:hypothetical protein